MHLACLGSGSHSPFSIHVVVLGPVSTSPGGQEKLKVLPSVTGTDVSLTAYVELDITGCPQFAVESFAIDGPYSHIEVLITPRI